MANTLTNMTSTMIQDEVLPALKLGLNPLEAFSYKTTGEAKNVGDVVRVPVATAKSAGTYSTTFESGNSTVASTAVTMAAPTFSSWFVNPYLEGAATVDRFLAEGREAAYAVAKSVVQSVLGKFVAANIGDVADTDKKVVAAASYDYSTQAALWGLLKTKGVQGPVSAIHTVDYAANLLDDSRLTDASASGSDVLQLGELPPILGVRQFYTDAFPSAVTSENTGVIYTGKQTAAVALAIPSMLDDQDEQAAGLRTEIITDPDTGLSMIYRQWVNTATGEHWGTVMVMHGESFVQDAAVRVVSA